MSTRVATRYAQSLIGLAAERDSLDQVHADMLFWQGVCAESREFVNMLRSPIIHGDKKLAILQKVGGAHMGAFTGAFLGLLVRKGRESDFPEIITAFLEQYNVLQDIHTVRLTTAVPVGEGVQHAFRAKLKSELSMDRIELEAAVDEKLIGGFTLEFDGKMVDASVARDLREVHKQFTQNVYVPKIKYK